jgi:hypothetical protein
MASAIFTSLAQLGSQYGEASNEAREEKQAQAEKTQKMSVDQAYLQIAQQAEERQQQEQEFRKKAGDLIEFKDGRIWSVSKGGFIEPQRPVAQADNIRRFIAQQPEKYRKTLSSEADALFSSGMNPQEVTSKVLEHAKAIGAREETEAAEEERRQKTQLSTDNRAKLARDAAAGRQRAGFAEREKLNSKVMTDHEAAIDADNRVTRMVADMTDANNAELHPDDPRYKDGAGAFDMDMLSQHVALTFGAIKGGMRSKQMIDEHKNAVAWLERIQRGYQSGVRGSQLSPQQRSNFLKLGRIAQQAAWDKYNVIKSDVQSGAVGVPQQQEFDIQPEEQPQ